MENDAPQSDLARASRAQTPWLLPAAIIFAGLVLAVAVYVWRTHHGVGSHIDTLLMAPVSPSDHIIGSPTAPVMLVEYADTDSSYSKDFQASMEQLMTQYAADGQVAWVYRHFPLIDQHPNAGTNAEAAECAATAGGPKAFWSFIDALDAHAPGDSQFDPADYPAVISQLGIPDQPFDQCLNDHTFRQRVGDQFNNAMLIGADGTPFTVVLVKGQQPTTISGDVPYATLKQIVDQGIQKAAPAKS